MKKVKSFDLMAHLKYGLAKHEAQEHSRRIKEGLRRKKNANK